MLESVTFGQYYPETSVIHSMDPRIKCVLSLVIMVAIFCASNALGLGLCALFIVGAYAVAHITPVTALRSLGPLLLLVVLTAVLNILFVQGGTTYFSFGIICISEKGILSAVFIGCRLLLLLLAMSLLTLTTTTLDITAAFEKLFGPLKKIGVPVHEMSMILGIALRFLPQFMRELNTIRKAQISRGAQLTSNPFKGGFQSLTTLLVPLFSSAFRHADTLAWAMDARCYHGANGRTSLTPLHTSWRDVAGTLCCIALVAIVIALRFM